MLYMICPTCGEPLGNKELVYIVKMKEACDELGIDDDLLSQGNMDQDETYIKKRQNIVIKLVKNPCCRMRLMNYIDLVQLVKG